MENSVEVVYSPAQASGPACDLVVIMSEQEGYEIVAYPPRQPAERWRCWINRGEPCRSHWDRSWLRRPTPPYQFPLTTPWLTFVRSLIADPEAGLVGIRLIWGAITAEVQ